MRRCGAEGLRLRPRGGGTKLGWGRPAPEPDVEVATGGLDRIVEHNVGDLTAVLQAGVPLGAAQAAFADAGQMLAVDPPVAGGAAGEVPDPATIGGVVAAADSGPLRHRYGAMRDLILGVTVALSDGTLARAGGKVIKNVAGYDLAKLFTGSFGTLGLVVEVAVRLHPRPSRTATAVGRTGDPVLLHRAVSDLAHAPLEADCLDVRWEGGAGAVLARFGSADPWPRVEEAATLLRRAGIDDVEVGAGEGAGGGDEDARWQRQRAGQRTGAGAMVKVSALAAELPRVVEAVEALSGALVGRAALGLSWVRLPGADAGDLVAAVEDLRRRLAPAPCVVLDAPDDVRAKVDPWGDRTGPVELMRRVKARFDPAGVCHPGVFVGGI